MFPPPVDSLGAIRQTPGTGGGDHFEYQVSIEFMHAMEKTSLGFCTSMLGLVVKLTRMKEQPYLSSKLKAELDEIFNDFYGDVGQMSALGLSQEEIWRIPTCVSFAPKVHVGKTWEHERLHARIEQVHNNLRSPLNGVSPERFIYMILMRAMRGRATHSDIVDLIRGSIERGYSQNARAALEEQLARMEQYIALTKAMQTEIKRLGGTKAAARKVYLRNQRFLQRFTRSSKQVRRFAQAIAERFGSTFRLVDWGQRTITREMVDVFTPQVIFYHAPER